MYVFLRGWVRFPIGGYSPRVYKRHDLVGFQSRPYSRDERRKGLMSTIEEAIEAIKNGRMIIVVDDPGRENQGDIFFPAQLATPENVNFLISECRGLVCAPLSYDYAKRFDLPLMVAPSANSESTCVNFTVSVDARNVTDFGISASDRALSLRALADEKTSSTDLVRPGHIFPLIANDGGILARQGHTEAAVELCELAGFNPCGVICEILEKGGQPARMPSLEKFAAKHSLPIVTIADLVKYQKTLSKTIEASLPTEYGQFQISVYTSLLDNREHVLLTCGDISKGPVLTRVHSKCLTGDTFLSLRCDCHGQLEQSMKLIQEEGQGAIVYLDQEGRGIGLPSKIHAYGLQEQGMDTAQSNEALGFLADSRSYIAAADILKDAGITSINLLSNNPEKQKQLKAQGIKVVKRIPLETIPHELNRAYLLTKKHKMGHRLTGV